MNVMYLSLIKYFSVILSKFYCLYRRDLAYLALDLFLVTN